MMYLLLLISLFTSAFGSNNVNCPDVEAVEVNDSINEGIWYQQGRYPNIVESSLKCIRYNANRTLNGGVIRCEDVVTEASFIENDHKQGILNVTMKSEVQQTSFNIIVKFLALDDNYIIAYGCNHDEDRNILQEVAWISTRKPQPLPETKEIINKFVADNKALDYEKFIWIDHSGCEY